MCCQEGLGRPRAEAYPANLRFVPIEGLDFSPTDNLQEPFNRAWVRAQKDSTVGCGLRSAPRSRL